MSDDDLKDYLLERTKHIVQKEPAWIRAAAELGWEVVCWTRIPTWSSRSDNDVMDRRWAHRDPDIRM
jgi:hypothetical protein